MRDRFEDSTVLVKMANLGVEKQLATTCWTSLLSRDHVLQIQVLFIENIYTRAAVAWHPSAYLVPKDVSIVRALIVLLYFQLACIFSTIELKELWPTAYEYFEYFRILCSRTPS